MQNEEHTTEPGHEEVSILGSSGGSMTRVHGGNIADAVNRYGIRERDIVDFSSNISPLGPSSAAIRSAKKALAYGDRYPDQSLSELRRTIARYFGIKPEHIVCGNGSTALIHLVPQIYRPKRVLIPVPTFTEYAAAALKAGAEVVPYQLKEKDGFRVDPIEMAFAFKGIDMAFLCNPNNPTGRVVQKNEMMEIVQYALQEKVTLVVDEAFMDFVESETIVKDAVQTSHVICIRAFSKFFGMPGLRVGYAVCGEEIASVLNAGSEPWPVNIPAQFAAIAALNDWGHIKRTLKIVTRERERLLAELRILPGVEPFPCAANFILIKFTTADGRSLTQALGLRGILVRDCSTIPGLDNRFIRVAVRTRSENARLLTAIRDILMRS